MVVVQSRAQAFSKEKKKSTKLTLQQDSKVNNKHAKVRKERSLIEKKWQDKWPSR